MSAIWTADRSECVDALTTECFRRDVLAGLSRPERSLPCKYLYDEEGARLFELICELEEYYPTRTEISILRENIREICAMMGARVNLVDLGSGSGLKTRLLLEHLDNPASYCPVDVSRKQLLESAGQFAREYPGIQVRPVCADFTNSFELPAPLPGSGPTVLFFPGSTVGNFEPRQAVLFLRRMARICGREGGLLIGVDLKKSPAVLGRAYDDAEGVTARFNLNLLSRVNRELFGDFEVSQFRHRAFYNRVAGRIEMHLMSRCPQKARVEDREFVFGRGESIRTEHSYKYTMPEFRRLAKAAGFEVARVWTDDRNWFSLQFLKISNLRFEI